MSTLVSAADWLFRDRATGQVVIGQRPNAPIIVWAAVSVARWVATGTAETTLGWIATGALVVWAGDELLRGVNPFRRILGAVVLGWVGVGLLRG